MTRAKDSGSREWRSKSLTRSLCFPLLGILFAFIVAARFAISHGEEWNTGNPVSALVLVVLVAGAFCARAGFSAWLQLSF